MKNLLLLIFTIAALTVSTSAQGPTMPTEPELIKLPKAINPKDGYTGGGPVAVRVTVNEKGEVTDAEFVSGPGPVCEAITRLDVLRTREAAVEVARQAKFAPATSGGQPIASTTIMSIQFAEPAPKPQKPTKPGEYTVKGDTNFSAAQAPEKPVGDAPPKTDEPTAKPDSKKYTMQPDTNYSVANAPPAANAGDFRGKTISGGVLNGSAISLPKPKYPAAARAVRATGAVQVQVLIDEDGNVFTAQAYGGHPLLQSASVAAACNAKFTPTTISGQPVKVSGIITYNFVP
jgi:TonB family protein